MLKITPSEKEGIKLASKFDGTNRFHYAWIIAIAGVLITGAGVGIFNSTLGVFIIPVTYELGFMRGQFTAYTTISMITMVILMPYFGSLFTRFGFRRIALSAAAAVGLVLLGFSFSTQLWHFYALAVVSGMFINGMGMMAVGILINKWFDDKKGVATGIAFSGSGLMAAFMIPVSNMIIEAYGWRFGFQFLAAVTLVTLMSVILFIIKDSPEDIGLKPYSVKKEDGNVQKPASPVSVGLTRAEAIRKVSFWLLVLSVFGIGLSQAGAHVKTVAFLNDIGYSPAFAATAASVYMVILTGNKVVIGWLMDRLGALKGGLLMGACCAIFPIFALFAGYVPMVWAYVVVLSIASSGATILGPIITARYFGRKDFAKVFSIVSMATMTGVAISIPGLGFVFDATGAYDLAWYLIIGFGILVCVCLVGVHIIRGKEVL